MSNLTDFFEDLSKSFQKKAIDLQTLSKDMKAMSVGLENDKPYSRSTVEPMTRLRQSKAEIEEAKKNPEDQFIKDRLHDILGI